MKIKVDLRGTPETKLTIIGVDGQIIATADADSLRQAAETLLQEIGYGLGITADTTK